MGSHGNYNVDFELAKLHQRQLRGERATDRIAAEAGTAPEYRRPAPAVAWRLLVRVMRVLVRSRWLRRGPLATAE